MNALAALQRLRAARTAAVAGVIPAESTLNVSTGNNKPEALDAGRALVARAVASKAVQTEARRILALPVWSTAEAFEQAKPGGPLDLTDTYRVPGGTLTLKPIQNLALRWIAEKRGLIGPIAVGGGKTLITLLAASAMKAQRPVLLIPPTLQIPLRQEIEKLGKHFILPKNLHIIPYSRLSVASSTALLEQLRPDLIIADEVHNLRNPDAARTKRVLRYFRQFPTTRFVALSGTLTSKSLRDYAHLCELALREGSPLPKEEADLLAWANCIDANGEPQDKDWSLFAAFSDVRHVPATDRQEVAREVFRQRFVVTPGVVATTEASVQCSLLFHERRPAVPTAVADALADLARTWCRPDGEEMDSALALWRLGMQISQGFYLRWVWPGGVVDHEWMNARAAWHREVRYTLQNNASGITGRDSPFLVYRAVVTGVLTKPSIQRAWAAWDKVRHRPKPPTETVWIDDYLIRDALAWHADHPQGIIWHADRATETALRAAGIPTYGRGEVPPLDGGKGGIACSIRVHGTGLNMQAHAESLVLSLPSSGKTCEQLIGRTHRQGQEADEVAVWYYAHTGAARDALATARADARYIEETHGSPQKLCYGVFV